MRVLLQLSTPGRTAAGGPGGLRLRVDGVDVEVPDDGSSLLEVLRHRLGRASVKDGCSPQGQCGCCTVWVDGQPRVACVTAARRVAGREVTTLEGLDRSLRDRWVSAFMATGASQCGFCTPGIVMRLAGLAQRKPDAGVAEVETALAAHLCRCTGWRTIVEAAVAVLGGAPSVPGDSPAAAQRDLQAAAARATLEGGTPQAVGEDVVCGRGGFAEDTAPPGALVAVRDPAGRWVLGETPAAARAAAGTVQGRNSTAPLRWPVSLPPGPWVLELATTFVEPAYLEPDASWCVPGGEPASPLANGGAFGGKRTSPVVETARRLAGEHGRAVRVLYRREDVVRYGPKRPPMAAGVRPDGSVAVRLGRTPGSASLAGWAAAFAAGLAAGRAALAHSAAGGTAPSAGEVTVEEVAVVGPPVSTELRAAGWAEGAVLGTALAARAAGAVGPGVPVRLESPAGAAATATVAADGPVTVRVRAGRPLDEVVLRSYCIGAAHQALGWVRSEGIAVGEDGAVLDLTIRSFGVLSARAMPAVDVVVEDDDDRPPLAVSDTVFAAVAAAAWLAAGLPARWPVERGGAS